MYADLHLHSTASDGQFTPERVVLLAKEKGFSAMALTDHDTVNGLNEALHAGEKYGIEVIPGIELSTFDEEYEIHILGYFIDPDNEELKEMLRRLINAREERAEKMVKKLNELGIHISIDKVREIAGNEFIGRPHVARAMLEEGYIDNFADAFTPEYIDRGGRAYVERFKLRPCEAIQLIKRAGGVPVVAHPGYLRYGDDIDRGKIRELIDCGLEGIEAMHSRHTFRQAQIFTQIAEKYGILITGGSDCHGGRDEEILMGAVKLPYRHVKALKEKAKSWNLKISKN